MEIIIKNMSPPVASKKVPLNKPISLKKFQKILIRKNREASEKQVIQIKFLFLMEAANTQQIEDRISLLGTTFSLTEHVTKRITETQKEDPRKYLEYVQIQKVIEGKTELIVENESQKYKEKNNRKAQTKTPVKIPFSINRKHLMKLVIAVIVLLIISLGVFLFNTQFKREVRVEKPTLQSYLNKKDYFAAAENFPKEKKIIEDTIVDNKDFKELEEFTKKYPTTEGEFDLAIYNQKWDKAIEIAERKDVTFSFKRKVMVTRSYIMLDRLEEAQIFNKSLESKELEEEITNGYFVRAVRLLQKENIDQAKKIEATINSDELSSLIKDAEIYKEMIDYYKKEPDNQKHWKNKLNNIGKELIEDE